MRGRTLGRRTCRVSRSVVGDTDWKSRIPTISADREQNRAGRPLRNAKQRLATPGHPFAPKAASPRPYRPRCARAIRGSRGRPRGNGTAAPSRERPSTTTRSQTSTIECLQSSPRSWLGRHRSLADVAAMGGGDPYIRGGHRSITVEIGGGIGRSDLSVDDADVGRTDR